MAGSVYATLAHIRADILLADHELALTAARVQLLTIARDAAQTFLDRHLSTGSIVGQYEDLAVARDLTAALRRFTETH